MTKLYKFILNNSSYSYGQKAFTSNVSHLRDIPDHLLIYFSNNGIFPPFISRLYRTIKLSKKKRLPRIFNPIPFK